MPKKKIEVPPKPIVLDADQQAAVNTTEGAIALIAGAGSGKTSVIVARTMHILETTPQEEVLALTFTAEAARNLRTRMGKLVNLPEPTRTCGYLTFHSLALSTVTQEADNFPFPLQPFPLATEGQSSKVLGELCRKFKVDFRELRSWVSLQKRQSTRPDRAVRIAEETGANQAKALAYKEYEAKMREAGVLDFDSLVLEMYELLRTRPDVLERHQYRYIMVDEFQDTDELQLQIVKLLSRTHGNVFAVGDPNQEIYSFRGSRPDILLNFGEHFPGAKILYLNNNYRATKALTEFNYAIAPHQPPEPYRSQNELGIPPTIVRFLNEFDEAEGVVKLIEDPDHTAILARTNRALRAFEEELSSQSVKYHLLGKSGFWKQPEIAAVVSYLQCAVSPYDNSVLGAIRAPFAPSRFIKKKQLMDELKAEKKADPNSTIWSLLMARRDTSVVGLVGTLSSLRRYADVPASKAVSDILQTLKAVDYYETNEANPDNNPTENLTELVRIAGRHGTLREFVEHIRKVQGASRVKKGVALGTAHAAKGREWADVYLTCCAEGTLPHKNAESVVEEQRIFFVGCSRAAKRLTISYSGTPSRFVLPFLGNNSDELTTPTHPIQHPIDTDVDPIEAFFGD